MQKSNNKKKLGTPVTKNEYTMNQIPAFINNEDKGSFKLKDKVAIIKGGDSGIGRSIAIAFAKQGYNVGIIYNKEHKDAQLTKNYVEGYGQKCLLISGDFSFITETVRIQTVWN